MRAGWLRADFVPERAVPQVKMGSPCDERSRRRQDWRRGMTLAINIAHESPHAKTLAVRA